MECRDCHEASLNVSLKHLADKGKDFTLLDFREEFRCHERTIYKIADQKTWMIMRKVYQDIMGEDSTIAPLSEESGMKVPFYVAHDPVKGRAVFASQRVKKGTLVWGERQMAHFGDIDFFRKFLVSLPFTELACDILTWAWVEQDVDGRVSVEVAFDEGSMFNDSSPRRVAEEKDEGDETEITCTGGSLSESGMICDNKDDKNDDEEASKGDDELPTTGCISDEVCLGNYALHDIDAGEEFTCDYREFADDEINAHLSL
jgi:hypothetical protein